MVELTPAQIVMRTAYRYHGAFDQFSSVVTRSLARVDRRHLGAVKIKHTTNGKFRRSSFNAGGRRFAGFAGGNASAGSCSLKRWSSCRSGEEKKRSHDNLHFVSFPLLINEERQPPVSVFADSLYNIQNECRERRERDGAGATAADDESVPIPSLCVVVTCPSKDTKGPNKGSDREAVAIIPAHTAIVNKRG